MPNYFIVTTDADTPMLMLSQKPMEEVIRSIRAWPFRKRAFIFTAKALPQPGSIPHALPSGCIQFVMEGKIEPNDRVEHYMYMLGSSIDDLPSEQALIHLAATQDYLDKKVQFHEGRLKEVQPESNPTGS